MGATRPRRWRLPFQRSAPSSPSSKSFPAPYSPALSAAAAASEAEPKGEQQEEAAPPEFLCPILGALMADPVILPSGQTYERACLQACKELSFFPPGTGSGSDAMIPNSALKAAIGTWCARSGRAVPALPSEEAAREAVLRAMPPPAAAAAAEAKSVRTRRPPVAASPSNSSYSSPASAASTSPSTSSSEITPAEEDVAVKTAKVVIQAVDPLENEVVAKVMDADEDGVVAAAMAALREATRESAERRRALCTPRLLAALRRVLLIPRHASARVDATAVLVNLSLEPANKVRIVRAGAVPALVEVLRTGGSSVPAEARENAAGALFGLALHEENRAAIGVLGAVPPLLDLLTSTTQHPRARRDAGMALYYLSLAAVNQSKVARFPGAPKALLAAASDAAEPTPIRRLALMVICNVGACAEGRATLMDAGAVAAVAGILSDDTTRVAELEEWCVAAIYALSRGSLRFRGLAHAAGADKALRRVADEGAPGGVRREMARKTLRAMRTDLDNDADADLTGSSLECGDGDDCGGSIVSDGLMSFRRRQRDLGASSCGNTTEF
ncbi:U-box domain-containing protein 39 [Brachypodium distachyon]|uniref:RING-type E3 ubiquitin transferase n=1 Tax=Brachypodium distachyon TaxID=15368 RepID=I1IPW1_BRADI|nr:U-box domain-containing protein 39 [Brachypodium distachyon]KQJ90118.1 hypothetical protein BRADI_4g29540v3 [Brachypodium distachyon]|eukprot:XP_003578071.1 U-box domain-containing protein 39 [Brachypodium distachyon]